MKPAIISLLLLALALGGCGRSDKPDTQFAPTKPLVGVFPVIGASMQPTLPYAHAARVDVAFPYEQLSERDIVLFWDYRREGYTLHRLVAKQGPWWIARGDNPDTNPEADAPFVTRANYMGRMVQ